MILLPSCAGIQGPGPVGEKKEPWRRGWSAVEANPPEFESGLAPVNYGGALLLDRTLIVGSERFGLQAFAAANGKRLWKKSLPEEIAVAPVSKGKAVFVGTEGGLLLAIDSAKQGKTLWETRLPGPIRGIMLLAFDRLFVGTADEAVHAIDPNTGKVLWVYRRPPFTGTGVFGGPSPAVVSGKIWVGFSDGTLVALQPEAGTVEFERAFRDQLRFYDLDAKVVGWKDGLLVATYDGKLRHLRKDGATVWEFPAGGARAVVLGGGDRILLPSSDGSLYSIDGNTGREQWRFSLPRGVPTSAAFVNQGANIAVVSSDRDLFLLDSASGSVLGRKSIGRGSGTYSSVVVDEESRSFYLVSTFSRVYQFLLQR
jgi:outer membrane protein assembly factor BamB